MDEKNLVTIYYFEQKTKHLLTSCYIEHGKNIEAYLQSLVTEL